MADVRWKDKTLLAYAGMAATDTMPITDTDVDTDKYTTLAEVKKYALENKTIGGSAVGDVTTNNGTQTLTGKRLDSPKINENVAVTATATEINKLTGCTATATEINKLTGCTATTAELNLTHTYAAKIPYLANVNDDIQGQINSLGISPEFLTHCYGLTFTAAGTDISLTESAILTALGLSTSVYYIDPTTMHGSSCAVSSGTYTIIDDTGVGTPNVTITWTVQTDGGQTHLTEIKMSGLTPASQYNIGFSFKVMLISGV